MNVSTKKALCLMALLSSAPMLGMFDMFGACRGKAQRQVSQTPTKQASNTSIIVRPSEPDADAATQKMIASALADHPSFTEQQIQDVLAAGKQSMEEYLQDVQSERVTFGQDLPPFTAVVGKGLTFALEKALAEKPSPHKYSNPAYNAYLGKGKWTGWDWTNEETHNASNQQCAKIFLSDEKYMEPFLKTPKRIQQDSAQSDK
jgi:hypothetical protein